MTKLHIPHDPKIVARMHERQEIDVEPKQPSSERCYLNLSRFDLKLRRFDACWDCTVFSDQAWLSAWLGRNRGRDTVFEGQTECLMEFGPHSR